MYSGLFVESQVRVRLFGCDCEHQGLASRYPQIYLLMRVTLQYLFCV